MKIQSRIVDSFVVGENTFALMTRIKGDRLIDTMSDETPGRHR